jgi:hypothetical protein
MDALTRMLAGLLRRSARALPAGRQDWGEAVCAEAADVPAGWARLRWLAGGYQVVAREAHLLRRLALAVGIAAAAVVVVVAGWHSGATAPGTRIERAWLVATVVMLAALPWVARRQGWFGPVADSTAARVVRAGGYALVCALLPVLVGLSRYAGARFDRTGYSDQDRADMVQETITTTLILFALIAAYAAVVLRMTSRRSRVTPATAATGVGVGALVGLLAYALTPLGSTLDVVPSPVYLALTVAVFGGPVLAGVLAAGRGGDALAQGRSAGLLAGVAATLVVTVLTITTMLLLPRHVHLKWANPDPTAAHGTTFELQMSVGDAAGKYLFFLLFGPLIGTGLGVVGGAITATRPDPADAVRYSGEEVSGRV